MVTLIFKRIFGDVKVGGWQRVRLEKETHISQRQWSHNLEQFSKGDGEIAHYFVAEILEC